MSSPNAAHDERAAKIRAANDSLRRTMPHGQVVLSQLVADLDPPLVLEIVKVVRAFDAFTPDNDPCGEHDFGRVLVRGEAYFWKIDAYDLNLEWGSPDAADEAVTKRIITIMTPSDL